MSNWTRAMLVAMGFLVGTTGAHGAEMASPGAQPAGYYPGIANGVPAYEYDKWWQWAHARTIAIHALWDRIKAAKASGELPGCIGQSVEDCVVTLAQSLALADSYTRPSFVDPVQIDVNGKSIAPKRLEMIAFHARVPGEAQAPQMSYLQERQTLYLLVSDANKVTEIIVSPGMMPFLRAQSEADYDRTAIYAILQPLTKTSCPQLAKLELYQFIENKLKPPVRNAAAIGATAKARVNVTSSPLLPFCGRKLKFEVRTERPIFNPRDLKIEPKFTIQ
jgi:hypothetical protein